MSLPARPVKDKGRGNRDESPDEEWYLITSRPSSPAPVASRASVLASSRKSLPSNRPAGPSLIPGRSLPLRRVWGDREPGIAGRPPVLLHQSTPPVRAPLQSCDLGRLVAAQHLGHPARPIRVQASPPPARHPPEPGAAEERRRIASAIRARAHATTTSISVLIVNRGSFMTSTLPFAPPSRGPTRRRPRPSAAPPPAPRPTHLLADLRRLPQRPIQGRAA